LDDCSAQVFPYNIFAYCSICRVDCKFAINNLTKIKLLTVTLVEERHLLAGIRFEVLILVGMMSSILSNITLPA
jgi:hypothetical protein